MLIEYNDEQIERKFDLKVYKLGIFSYKTGLVVWEKIANFVYINQILIEE